MRNQLKRNCFIALVFALTCVQCAILHAEEKEYSCIVHVHTKSSDDNAYELPELTEIAKQYGIDAVFLSDNRTVTIEYGLPPLRHILWAGYSRTSLMKGGPEEYLAAVKAENSRQDDVLYIPGVEVVPRFYWTGRLTKDITCRDHQRNIIVLGCNDADIVRNAPEACGFVWGRDSILIIVTRFLLVALVLSVTGLFWLPGYLARRTEFDRGEIRSSLFRGVVLPLVLISAVLNLALSFVPRFQIYGAGKSDEQAQRLVDYFSEKGLVHYWGHPEAFDDHSYGEGMAGFKVHTEPYAEILNMTSGYTGFGGLYEGRNTLVAPGGKWDQLLDMYIKGEREKPIWCFGEMLYRYEGHAGKKLKNVETIVRAKEKTAKALTEALREGKFYSRKNFAGAYLDLRKSSIVKGGDGRVVIDVDVVCSKKDEKIELQVVRSGELIRSVKGVGAAAAAFEDDAAGVKGRVYYRILVKWKGGYRLATNPVFVDVK